MVSVNFTEEEIEVLLGMIRNEAKRSQDGFIRNMAKAGYTDETLIAKKIVRARMFQNLLLGIADKLSLHKPTSTSAAGRLVGSKIPDVADIDSGNNIKPTPTIDKEAFLRP